MNSLAQASRSDGDLQMASRHEERRLDQVSLTPLGTWRRVGKCIAQILARDGRSVTEGEEGELLAERHVEDSLAGDRGDRGPEPEGAATD